MILTGAVFLDLRKAFDTVNTGLLMIKLNALKIDGNEVRWFINSFKERTQCVYVDGHMSKPLDIVFVWEGDPRGSILGSLLFTLYVNDQPEEVKVVK